MYSLIILSTSLLALPALIFLVKKRSWPPVAKRITVILGDPRLPDAVKKNGAFSNDDLDVIGNLKKNLGEIKEYQFTYLDAHGELLDSLSKHPPKGVLNLCDEGFRNSSKMELHVPAYLEMLGIPYTGSGPACLAISFNKSLVSNYAKSVGIPVPRELLIHQDVATPPIPEFFPALLKPALGDGSIGITERSVVHSKEEFVNVFKSLRALLPHTPIIVQEFLSGREFSVGVIGNDQRFTVLPVLEIDYSALPTHLPKILAYESKWDYGTSPFWNNIEYRKAEHYPETIIEYSLKMFNLLGCRDYAVFDFREDANGQVRFLEVNPNPGWGEGCTLDAMAKFKGWNYQTLLRSILTAAEQRWKL